MHKSFPLVITLSMDAFVLCIKSSLADVEEIISSAIPESLRSQLRSSIVWEKSNVYKLT